MVNICKVCGTKSRIKNFHFGEVIWCDKCDREICPDCGAHIRSKELNEGGGIECNDKCGYWFCF